MKHRFHVLSLAHTVTSKEYISCAYTQKVIKFCKMMKDRGHTIYLYAHERSNADCDVLIPVTDDSILAEAYGEFNWKENQFKHNTGDFAQLTFNKNAIREISKHKKSGDFLLCFWGIGHQPIAMAHQDLIAVEPGVGYHMGLFASYRVFESYSVRDIAYEKMGWGNPDWNDAVIPNYFDSNDFDYQEKKEDYFLYIGRLIKNKGIEIAMQASTRAGVKLIIAGQGNFKELFPKSPANVEFVGFADVDTRRSLLSKAAGLYVPSLYVEPFGGVMIEAFLSGTPVISTDWGSFAENNLHGITGYRCRNMEQFVWATKNIKNIKPSVCREWAENFTLERVSKMYEEYFNSLHRLKNKGGWYHENPERTELDWMKLSYPKNC